jgi:sec-independent protein translocase protein TatC
MKLGVSRDDEARMTFTEHLGELRSRLMVAVGTVLVSGAVCFFLGERIFQLLARPLGPLAEAGWVVLNPIESVWVYLQLGLYAGLFISMPVVVYEICAFVFPGLKPNEKRVINMLIFGGGGLALAGIALAYFQVLPQFLPMILTWVPDGVMTQLRMSETISFLIKFLLAFAIAFQFPLILLILVYLDLLSPATLRHYRRIAIVLMAVGAAMLTPGPDVFSMFMMFVPLYIFYEATIWLSYVIVWRRRKKAAAGA